MIITVLEGRVKPELWKKLKDSFASGTENLPATMRETFLLQDDSDKEIWRIITVWESRAALHEYRESVAVPEGIVWFRNLGLEPKISFWDVENYAFRST